MTLPFHTGNRHKARQEHELKAFHTQRFDGQKAICQAICTFLTTFSSRYTNKCLLDEVHNQVSSRAGTQTSGTVNGPLSRHGQHRISRLPPRRLRKIHVRKKINSQLTSQMAINNHPNSPAAAAPLQSLLVRSETCSWAAPWAAWGAAR